MTLQFHCSETGVSKYRGHETKSFTNRTELADISDKELVS